MEIKKDWRPVARWIRPDVPAEIYRDELKTLVDFASNFEMSERTYRLNDLIAKIEGNSIAFETVIRAVGETEKSVVYGEVYYTYVMKTDCFKASHLPEKGIINVLIAGDLGFDKEGRLLNGCKLRLPDGSGSKEWLKPTTPQLVGYNNYGILNKTVNVNNIRTVKDFRLIRDKYKEAVLHIIKFADSKK